MLPALNAFRAVEASVMIESWIVSSLTELALRHFVFFVSVMDASWDRAAQNPELAA